MAERSEAGGRAAAEGPSLLRLQKPSAALPNLSLHHHHRRGEANVYLGHSQAAPRTPLESPNLAFTMGVATLSEKTNLGSRKGTSR